MDKLLGVVALIETPGSTGTHVSDDTTNLWWVVTVNSSADPLVPLFPPVQYGEGLGVVTVNAAAAEVRQEVLVGEVEETIVASRKYQIRINQILDKYESGQEGDGIYSYTAPAVLSGSAHTDRSNVYTVLVSKINSHTRNNVEATLVSRMPYDTGTTEPTYGELITGGTSTETAIIIAWEVVTGTWAANTAAGYVWIYDASGSFQAEAVTGATTADFAATAVQVDGQAIHIQDDASYYLAGRSGISAVYVTAGFTAATSSVELAGVYSLGVGTEMLANIPVFDRSGQDLIRGDLDLYDVTPVAGSFYTRMTFRVKKAANKDAMSDMIVGKVVRHVLWVKQTSVSSRGTNNTAVTTNLNTVLAK